MQNTTKSFRTFDQYLRKFDPYLNKHKSLYNEFKYLKEMIYIDMHGYTCRVTSEFGEALVLQMKYIA